MPSPRRRSGKKIPAAALPPTRPRWRMVPHSDGVSQVAERTISRSEREREQAVADFYGDYPFTSTGERLLPVSSILAEVLSRLNVQETELAPELLAKAWQSAVGGFLADQAQLTTLINGVAGVRTSHPAVRFEIQRNSRIIIRRLNAALGEGCVHSLRVHHG